jgi:hypothetical protein
VDLVEKRRYALHFIEHDDLIGRQGPQLKPEQCRVGGQRLIPALVKQVDDVRIGEGLTRPGALTDPTGAIEERGAADPVRRLRNP